MYWPLVNTHCHRHEDSFPLALNLLLDHSSLGCEIAAHQAWLTVLQSQEHPCHSAINLHCNNIIFTGPFLIVVNKANGTSSLTQFAWLTCWPRGFKLRPLVAPQDFQLLRSLPLPSLFPSVSFLQHATQPKSMWLDQSILCNKKLKISDGNY